MLSLFVWFLEIVDPAKWKQIDKGPLSFHNSLSSLLKLVAEFLQTQYFSYCFSKTVIPCKGLKKETDPDNPSIIKTNYHQIQIPGHGPPKHERKFGRLMSGSDISQVQVHNPDHQHELPECVPLKGEHWCKTIFNKREDWRKTNNFTLLVLKIIVLFKRNKPPNLKIFNLLSSSLVLWMQFVCRFDVVYSQFGCSLLVAWMQFARRSYVSGGEFSLQKFLQN